MGLVTQVKLSQRNRFTFGWVKADKRLKPGARVRLKETGEWWDVDEVYDTMEKEELHTDWKVGGNTRHDH